MQMKIILAAILCFAFRQSFSQSYYMLVGTYNSPDSTGIHVYKFNSQTGVVEKVSQAKTSNPSYLTVSPDKKYVYAVNEEGPATGGKVVSFSFDKKMGTISTLSHQSSEGVHPCYITIDKKGERVIVGNYTSGNLAVLPVKKGILGKAIQTIQHEGSGPDTARQKSPHVHGIFFDKDKYRLFVTDLGNDKIMTYFRSPKTGMFFPTKMKYVALPPGSGPRHLDFSPDGKYVYLLNELISSVTVLRNDGNADLVSLQNLTTLPLTFKGKSTAADIHVSPDGKFLYASNRGISNSIAIFSIDQKTGMITLVGHQYTEGETPRNFNFDPTGKFLLVANQNSNSIVVFKRDVSTGLLIDTGNRINVGKPVCIKWID
jgi:6-phosphogluconolactonase